MLGNASDIHRFQNGMNRLAAVAALGAVDFSGYFAIEILDLKINTPDREIRSLEKAAECPVGVFALLRKLLNSLDVCFKFHRSDSSTTKINDSAKPRPVSGELHFIFPPPVLLPGLL
jgi:hypothetical protein